MAVSKAQPLVAMCVLASGGCAADRYQWNLGHETVTAKPKLARHDVEEITRLVTRATFSPISRLFV